MSRVIVLMMWVLVALTIYPLGVLIAEIGQATFGFAVSTGPSFSVSFVLIQLLALVGLGSLSPLQASSLRGAAVKAIAWTVAGHGVWVAANFLLGSAGALDRTALASTAVAQVGLSFTATIFASNVTTAFAAAGALALVGFAYPLILHPASATVAELAPALAFIAATVSTYALLRPGTELAAMGSPVRYAFAITRWIVAAHVVWLLLLFFTTGLQNFPRSLPMATGVLEWLAAVAAPLGFLFLTGRLRIDSIIKSSASADDPNTHISLELGSANGRRTAWIISYTGVSNEPRVLRQSRALLDDGWRVVVCGYDGHSPRPPEWTFVRLPNTDPYRGTVRQLLGLSRMIGQVVAVLGRPAAVTRSGALFHHLCTPNWMHVRHSLLRLAAANPDLKPDLVLCNDYFTGDVGHALARRHGAKLAVDCHEYAAEQNAHDPKWLRWDRPCITAVQDYYLTRADVVSTVCDGIADLLNKDHVLKRPVVVVRSVPEKQLQAFRPTGDRIKVLYHGGIWHVRQLHTAIESMRQWRPEFDLILRGEGDVSYIAELRRLAHRYGLEGRVFFEGNVPFQRIIPEANKADIGYFSYANFSKQSQFVLPNKFFEYMMSGLALCVIDLAEMGRLARKHDLGKCIPEHKPEAIAATINSFTRADIDRYKRNSLKAAEELNWDREQQNMLGAYNELYGERSVAPRPVRMETASASTAA